MRLIMNLFQPLILLLEKHILEEAAEVLSNRVLTVFAEYEKYWESSHFNNVFSCFHAGHMSMLFDSK